MAKGRFQRWLKPDHRQKQVKPQISVASYVVDNWRRGFYAMCGVTGVSVSVAVLAVGWAFAKERMPTYNLTPMLRGDNMVETYIDESDKPIDDRIACAVLREIVTKLRAVSGPKSALKSRLEIATNAFADKAAIRARRELDAQDWYAPLIDGRRTREVLPNIECYALAGNENAYNLKWTERVYTQLYTVDEAKGGERVLSVITTRVPKVPADLAKWNPWGLMISEYSGILD